MAARITRDIIESYLNCKYKGHLKLAGQQGARADYETLLSEARSEVRLATIDSILARHAENQVERNVPLSPAALKRGALFVLDATLENEELSLCFDGLKRTDGPSKLGDFHYVPVLFEASRQVSKSHRLLLEVYGL